jgi:hypothetical protein
MRYRCDPVRLHCHPVRRALRGACWGAEGRSGVRTGIAARAPHTLAVLKRSTDVRRYCPNQAWQLFCERLAVMSTGELHDGTRKGIVYVPKQVLGTGARS